VLLAASLASAQQAQRITPNFKDADITQIAEAVSAATGKTFIVDPRVRAQVDDAVHDPDVTGCILRDVLVHPAGVRLHRGAGRKRGQDPPRCQRAPDPVHRPARPRERHLG